MLRSLVRPLLNLIATQASLLINLSGLLSLPQALVIVGSNNLISQASSFLFQMLQAAAKQYRQLLLPAHHTLMRIGWQKGVKELHFLPELIHFHLKVFGADTKAILIPRFNFFLKNGPHF